VDDWRIRQNPIVSLRDRAGLHFDPRICQHTRRHHRILHALKMNAADFEKLSDEEKEHFFNVLERAVAALVYFLLLLLFCYFCPQNRAFWAYRLIV
jgi:hypothetical protein